MLRNARPKSWRIVFDPCSPGVDDINMARCGANGIASCKREWPLIFVPSELDTVWRLMTNPFPADVRRGDDRGAIVALLDRLCVAMDAVDEAGIRACFAFEQAAEPGDGMIASEAFCAAALHVLRGLAWSHHRIEDSSILIHGDTASASSSFVSRSRSPTAQGEQEVSETVLEGIYHDRLIRQGASWKLTGRRLELRP